MSTLAKIKAYEEAKKRLEEAENWWKLRESIDAVSQGHFFVSVAHCKVSMAICGQHYEGGKNYHESPDALNKELAALLSVDKALVLSAIQQLRYKERALALDASKDLEDILSSIREAKER